MVADEGFVPIREEADVKIRDQKVNGEKEIGDNNEYENEKKKQRV